MTVPQRTPQRCTGPACNGRGTRVEAGLGPKALLCRACDGAQLIDGPLTVRPPDGYQRKPKA